MTKCPQSRTVKRLVTFLTPKDYKLFRELAYQRNQHTSQLIREIIHRALNPAEKGR